MRPGHWAALSPFAIIKTFCGFTQADPHRRISDLRGSPGAIWLAAVGLMEGINDYYLEDKQRQCDVFGNACKERGVATYNPACTLGVWIMAEHCLPHIPKYQGPGTALATQAYIEGGVGLTSMDSLHRGHLDPDDPTNLAKTQLAPFELIRCAFPRRAYTDSHYEWCADPFIGHGGERVPGYRRWDMVICGRP